MITPEIQFQIDCLVVQLTEILMEKDGWDMKRALDELYTSDTFARLTDPECGLYFESSVYVFSFLQSEIETGKLA